jgi:hypothetical protein
MMDSLAPHYGDDFWFLAYHAMALSEDGQLAAAHPKIERSLALNPNNAHGAHGFAHVCNESGEADTGRTFLSSWLIPSGGSSGPSVIPAKESVIQSPPDVLEFGNGHLKREFAGCGITKPPRDRKRNPRPPSDFGAGRRQVKNRDWITSPKAGTQRRVSASRG